MFAYQQGVIPADGMAPDGITQPFENMPFKQVSIPLGVDSNYFQALNNMVHSTGSSSRFWHASRTSHHTLVSRA